jgi:membrane protein CcdC involved in cytochrome C biogenesis
MRVISSIIAAIILASLLLAFRIWTEVDPHFGSRDQIVVPLLYLFASTGAISAVVALILASRCRLIALGFGVYSILHGAVCIYQSWRWGYQPGVFDFVSGVSICAGLRAVMMMRKKHDHAA